MARLVEARGDAIRSNELFVEGWEFMQILGEGAYGEYVTIPFPPPPPPQSR